MRISANRLAKWFMYITMAGALSLLKPIGEFIPIFAFGYAINWMNIILVLMSFALLIYSRKRKMGNRFLVGMVTLVCGAFFMRLGIDFVQGRDIYKEMNAHCTYLYIILTVVVYELLKRKTITLEHLIDTIIIMTIISYCLRASISWFYGISGKRILSSIALESAAENWIRNGTLRVNPPCFAMYIVPLCFYRYANVESWKSKISYMICISFAIMYSALITVSRAMVISQILETLFCLYIMKKTAIKKIISILIGLIVLTALLSYGIIDYFIDMFSVENTLYGLSNNIRLRESIYFIQEYLDNFWFGKGMLLGNELMFRGNIGGLGDCGALRSLVMMGFPMLLFYLIWISRNYIVGFKMIIMKVGSSERLLILGIIFSITITIFHIDCFYAIFVYSVPFALAISEYAIEDAK